MRRRGAKSFVDDLVLSRGVVLSRADLFCDLLRLSPMTRRFVRFRRTYLLYVSCVVSIASIVFSRKAIGDFSRNFDSRAERPVAHELHKFAISIFSAERPSRQHTVMYATTRTRSHKFSAERPDLSDLLFQCTTAQTSGLSREAFAQNIQPILTSILLTDRGRPIYSFSAERPKRLD